MLLLVPVVSQVGQVQTLRPPEAILQAFDAMALKRLWPGYEPGKMPVAIYDGHRTWLIRHPHPPAGFVPAGSGWLMMEGRLEAVTANSSADINGVMTATLMPAEGLDPATRAATMIHECFHVYQRKKHPSWVGNEAELFTYPAVDGEVLATRWKEEADLWSALRAGNDEFAKAYAKRAMVARAARFARVGEGATAYERGCELNEGLATLVEFRAAGRKAFDTPLPPRIGAEHLRNERVYAIGPAFGELLDRFLPGWEERLNKGGIASLDAALSESVRAADLSGLPPLDPGIRRDAIRAAAEAAKARASERSTYLAQPGWSIEVVAAPGRALQTERFDPWNVESLDPGFVLHIRYLRLGNGDGRVEMLDQRGLTEAAGKHPLWDGVARFRVAGLAARPDLTRTKDGRWSLKAKGIEGEFGNAQVAWIGKALTITLGAGR